MFARLGRYGRLPVIFWALAIFAIAIWSLVPGYAIGWDSEVYATAMQSLHAGHDPYVDGMVAQQAYHAQAVHRPEDEIPYTYVYCPITLPLLAGLSYLQMEPLHTIFWMLYFAGLLTTVWVGLRFVHERERFALALMAPAAVFFPGLLQNDALFSGNIAYIFYGCLLLAALVGWRRGSWWVFYVTLFLVSCWKPHLLTLLAIPVLSARRQWWPAAGTAACGVAVFVMQPRIWPELFRNYLRAADLQFAWNHDFGANPAAVLTHALMRHVEYHRFGAIAYVLFAAAVFFVLMRGRRMFLLGEVSLADWVPVMLVGVVLMNPRIMEYDVSAITVPLALVVWRCFGQITATARGRTTGAALFFAGVNAFAPFAWKGFAPFVGDVVQAAVLVVVFVGGVWLLRSAPPGGNELTSSVAGTRGGLSLG